jgi:two-component system sensor histidine kinase ChvG
MFGILYLSQYQNNLINARLETFKTELELISSALSESALKKQNDTARINIEQAYEMTARLAAITRQRIQIFDTNGTLVLDSRTLPGLDDRIWAKQERKTHPFHSVEVLRSMTRFILGLLPERQTLPAYPQTSKDQVLTFPDVPDALNEKISVSVWQTGEKRILLSAAAPLRAQEQTGGAILLTHEATEIEEDISLVWTEILKIFLGTLVLTTLLSIYLSGMIAQPLKKLAKAAEAVRKGKAGADHIPDLSHRHDEIGELSVVLRQMTEALWERMDSIERFAADVSHELKNPLTSLKSAVETASIVKKPSDRKKLTNIIKHDIERLERLITDISNASRIDTELSRTAFEKVNLKELLNNLLDSYAADPLKRTKENAQEWNKTIRTPQATLTLRCLSKNDIFVWGLESRLAQTFENILSNALSFTPKGGTISLLVVPLDKKVRITIEDEGPGIPESKLENIFERFYSERPKDEDYGRHSGLGLSICRQIIEAHGGQIYAENISIKRGEINGARFTITLNTA